MQAVDPFMTGIRPNGLQKGRGGFLRSADDAPYVTDPSGELCKTGDRKGEIKRVKYGSPSNRGRDIEPQGGLMKYKQRLSLAGIGMDPALAEACRALAELPVGSPEFNTAADTIVVQADKLTRSSLAADRGTHGHLLCERVDRGEEWGDLLDGGAALGIDFYRQRDVVSAWYTMLASNGLEILAIEASCVDDKWRLAGTLDRIVRTTKPLTFAKSTGELVTIPANTVLILDIKFGKCRKAHPIQIASYDQSVPYDTDTETRGEWGFELSHEHALIAHGDFGDDLRPVSIELVWVDLIAGREHGGQCVVDAKAWAARDDVFSVAQIVEGEEPIATQAAAAAPSTFSPESSPAAGEVRADERPTLTPSPAAGEVRAGSLPAPSPATSPWCWGVNDLLPLQGLPQHALDEVDRLNDQWRRGYDPTPRPDPDRLALVDARGALCPSPDEGADWSTDEYTPLWEQLKDLFDELGPGARNWRSELAGQAKRRHVDFLAQGGRTERRFWINKAVIALALAGESADDILRELLAHIIGDVALFAGVEPGHALGSLNAVEAQSFAHHVDAYLSPPPAA